MGGSDAGNIIKELSEFFLHNYQEKEQIISGSEFNFESDELMDYKLHRVRLRRGGSYISEHNLKQKNKVLLLMINGDEKYYYFAVKSKLELYSSEWLRSKKESVTNEDNCFQNALKDLLDYQRIKKHPQKISKLKPCINQYNW